MKKNQGKLFRKYGLRNPQEELVLSQESAKDFGCFHGFFLFCFLVIALFSNYFFLTHRPFFLHILDQIFRKICPKLFFCCFYTLDSKSTRNMCEIRHKGCNSQNLPNRSQNFKNFQSGFSN